MGQDELIMEDEEEVYEEPMMFIPLPSNVELFDGAIKIPACLAVSLAINILVQKDMLENS